MATTILERFFDRVEMVPEAGCWIWMGCIIGRRLKHQYGLFNSGRGNVLCHRFSWEIHNALEVPYGMHVLHRCDVTCCVNPYHLFLGTHQDNMRDMRAKGRGRGQPGTTNSKNKLSNKDVEFIREERRRGVTCEVLADNFGVVHSTISRISAGRGWKVKKDTL
jgi:hypothetical protein